MRNIKIFRTVVLWTAIIGICCPQMALSATPPQTPTPIVDVTLQGGGMLLGQVVDTRGSALPDTSVSLAQSGKSLGTSKTDKQGYFAFAGLRGGVHQIAAPEGRGVYRLWQPGTAPPSAQQGAMVVSDSETVRGQLGGSAFWLSNPLIIGAIVATAVAVPVAVHNSRKSPSSP